MMKSIFALALVASAASLKADFSDSHNERPVAKVVRLLKEMQDQIQTEAAADAEMYEQMGCWCETNDREKTQAVADAQARITDLNSAVPAAAAKAAQLDVEIKHLKKQIGQNTNALEEATEIRAKEQADFRAEEKDAIQSVTSLKGAVQRMGHISFAQAQELIAHHMQHHRSLFEQSLSSKDHHFVVSLLQHPTAMLQQKGKTPASDQILGILKGMKESFETNMASSSKDEEDAVAQFADMKAAKQREITAAKDQVDAKTLEMAEAVQKNAQGKEDLVDTRNALSADNEFLSNLKLKCQNADKEYEDRVKIRNEELVAVSQTMEILNSDDSKDQFNKDKSMSNGFLQVLAQTVRSKKMRVLAAEFLSKAGKQLKNPRLATLATSMRLSGFEKVKESIDKMVEALKAEQKTEVDQKDYCVKEFNQNDAQNAQKMDLKGDLEQQINSLSSSIDELTEAIATLSNEVAETRSEMKKASELREKANHEFQVTINDQRATQAILQKAVDKLTAFYDDKTNPALVQQPAQGTYKKSGGAAGIMAMISTLIDESKALEAESMKGESDEQAGYETFMKDSNAAVDAASRDIANKSEEKAKNDAARVGANGDLKNTIADLLSLGEYGQQLHESCDFLVKNFDLRQSSRTQEMEALSQAKAIFSGAKL